jgi:nucleoside-diphosphate-sugar epimerase
MNYFLTGATGFIGGGLARKLIEQGHTVNAVVRNLDKAQDLIALGVRLFKADITEKESMRQAMTDRDGVFHLAAWYKLGQKDSSMARQINVEGSRNVLELAQELAIPKIVYTSTLAVNSNTHGKIVDESYRFEPGKEGFLSEYDRSKWLAHYEVAEPFARAGLPLVTVMPGLVYGPGDTSLVRDTLIRFLGGKLPLLPQQTAYSWAYIDDIVMGHILAMEKGKPGETYIIAGPSHTLIEAVELAEKLTGVKAPGWRPGPAVLKAMAGLMALLGRVASLPEIYHPETLRTMAGVSYTGDNSKARHELGYQPRSLAEGLKETLEHEMKLLGMVPPSPRDPVKA